MASHDTVSLVGQASSHFVTNSYSYHGPIEMSVRNRSFVVIIAEVMSDVWNSPMIA